MAEFDDKLNSILSNPDAMAQIMQLAQSIGGNTDQQSPPLQTEQSDRHKYFSGMLWYTC